MAARSNNQLQSSEVEIFFKIPFKNSDVSNLTLMIKAMPGVTKVVYLTQEDAYNIYKQKNKDNPALLQLATAENLPASLDVFVSNQSGVDTIENVAKGDSYVSQVIKSPNY